MIKFLFVGKVKDLKEALEKAIQENK